MMHKNGVESAMISIMTFGHRKLKMLSITMIYSYKLEGVRLMQMC